VRAAVADIWFRACTPESASKPRFHRTAIGFRDRKSKRSFGSDSALLAEYARVARWSRGLAGVRESAMDCEAGHGMASAGSAEAGRGVRGRVGVESQGREDRCRSELRSQAPRV
jgi:hypothetical protein